MPPARRLANLLSLAGWLAVLALVAWLLCLVRARTIAALAQPEAQARWQEWRRAEEARHDQQGGPVARRPPRSAEPPALVLLRDSFPAIVLASLLIASVLYAFTLFVARGLLARRRP
jgi:hypothetical protein